jgi:hypothetical protein
MEIGLLFAGMFAVGAWTGSQTAISRGRSSYVLNRDRLLLLPAFLTSWGWLPALVYGFMYMAWYWPVGALVVAVFGSMLSWNQNLIVFVFRSRVLWFAIAIGSIGYLWYIQLA